MWLRGLYGLCAVDGFALVALRQAQGDRKPKVVMNILGFPVTLSLSKGHKREAIYSAKQFIATPTTDLYQIEQH
ncbi:MAG: hypothetical protein EOO39_50500 [Cytophagaceae bacterium]|nr:MAG: hypothetical protein EOO39_50500 [Cytophagaceae bacterium]